MTAEVGNVVVRHRRAALRYGWLLVWLVLALPQAVRAEAPTLLPVVVETAEGQHLFRAELAATPETRAQGLMFREHLDPDAGMLFLFEPPRRVSFWMKNTLIPLDMLFIDATGRIVDIAPMTEPHSLEPRGPEAAVRAVLEINGGLSERLGIDIGDRVRTPALAD